MTKKTSSTTQEKLNAKYDHFVDCLKDARRELLKLDDVIGVGYGPREKGGQIIEDEPCIIVYVEKKKDKKARSSKELIPAEFRDIPTDVVVPGQRARSRRNEYDFMCLDWVKIHANNPQREIHLESTSEDYDLDHVAVLEVDDTFVSNGNIDWVKAFKRFLIAHPDAFDFMTFYVDTSTGLPSQGSFFTDVYNETKGINFPIKDNRSEVGSTKIQGAIFMGNFLNRVLLQEFGHRWAAYVRNRDTQNGPLRYDLLIGQTGQDKYHWGHFFDNDHSPMDYDGIDWEALGSNIFQSHSIDDDFFHYCSLDLYLMGLLPAKFVGSFYVIQNPSGSYGAITGTQKNMTVQNVIWAEGERDPAFPNTQKVWKQAFVVLTKDAQQSRTFARQVAQHRREFTWQFYKATRFLGKVDTTLTATTHFPQVKNVTVAVDNDRAIVGWKTTILTKGKVNFATSSDAFQRDRAHTKPFTTVDETTVRTSHGVVMTELTPDTTYYFEIIVSNGAGLVDRIGPRRLSTRRTNDTTAPDINNLSLFVKHSTTVPKATVTLSWVTDELADSRVYFGNTIPPSKQIYDPYPSTNHRFKIGVQGVGFWYFRIESRDAGGNISRDDNNGNYYIVYVFDPGLQLPNQLAAVNLEEELNQEIEQINSAIEMGDLPGAVEETSELIARVAKEELDGIVKDTTLPEDDLDAGCKALEILITRQKGKFQVIQRGIDFIDFQVMPDPLWNMTCISLPSDIVAHECGYPLLLKIISKVRLGLILEPHPTLGMSSYRLRRSRTLSAS